MLLVEKAVREFWRTSVTGLPKPPHLARPLSELLTSITSPDAVREERLIKAVEVDIPGCSFNPDLEQHQDAVAEAVAAEMAKVYALEHAPKSKLVFNHMPEADELETLLVIHPELIPSTGL